MALWDARPRGDANRVCGRPAGAERGTSAQDQGGAHRWYLASVRSIARRFETADTADRIRLLRELERLAYQEMRRFLITFKEARFVM